MAGAGCTQPWPLCWKTKHWGLIVVEQILRYRYRLLPTRRQHAALANICELQRQLYNAALQERIDCYRKTGKGIFYAAQTVSLTTVRKDDPSGYGNQPVSMQRGTLQRLDRAFKAFFLRVKRGGVAGYPRFKGKDWFTSFVFSEFYGIRFDGKRLRWKGLPGALRVHFHRPLPDGKVLDAVFKRDSNGWFVSFAVRVPCAVRRVVSIAVGMDAGLKSLAHLSDDTIIPNPRPTRRAEKELRRRQRALTRCKLGSNRRRKVRAAFTACHRKIANTRATGLHQTSAALVTRYDFIAIEALNVKGLASSILANDVHDAAWGKLFSMLRYKALRAGATLVEVDPKYTSQACSGCGVIVAKTLSERVHSCSDCGLVLDRDHNAAINILHRAVLCPGGHNVGGSVKRARGNLKVKGISH
jgi:putative transposase